MSDTCHEISLQLPYRPPYDWDAMLGFLRLRAIPGIEQVQDDTYARSICLDGDQGTVTLRPAAGHTLQATVRFPRPQALPAITARLRRVFDLDSDPAAMGAHFAQDPLMSALIQARPGLRVPGAWDGFELAMRAVLGQQITVVAAIRLAGKLVAAHGKPMAHPEDGLTHVFPTPEAVAGAELASLGMPRSRAATLSAVAASAMADPQLFDASGGLEAALRRLREIRGVGDWTAQYIALRHCREPDAFPSSDIGLIRALERLESRTCTPAQLLARSESWRPWRAYAAQHLWTA